MPVASRNKIESIAPYKQIERDLKSRIESGEWRGGMMIPSRRALAEEYNVELPTVQRAVAGLLKCGVLRADGGRGTFVVENASSHGNAAEPSDTKSRLSHIGVISTLRSVHADGTVDPNYWNSSIVQSIERRIASEGGSTSYANLVGWLGDDANTALAAQRLVDGGAQALLIVLARGGSIYHRQFAQVCDMGLPIVYVGATDDRLPICQVFFDDHDGGQHAALHLLDQGARRLLFIDPFEDEWAVERLRGVRSAIGFRGLDTGILTVCMGEKQSLERRDSDTEQAAYQYSKGVLDNGIDFDAVIAANDIVAYGFIQAAQERGLSAGADYMIVGFDDDPRSREIGLTTMRPPLESMAEEAVRLIANQLFRNHQSSRHCLHLDLIARQSTNSNSPEVTGQALALTH